MQRTKIAALETKGGKLDGPAVTAGDQPDERRIMGRRTIGGGRFGAAVRVRMIMPDHLLGAAAQFSLQA